MHNLFLFFSKLLRILRIRLGYVYPTIYTRIQLSLIKCPYGKNLKVCGKTYFRTNSLNTIKLGSNIHIISRFLSNTVGLTNPTVIECIGKGSIYIGDNTGMSSVIISSMNKITIGKNVKIGGNSRIFDHDFHSLNENYRRNDKLDFFNVRSSPVIIEDDVFIGTNVIILKGVHIGARSIISAGSVVNLKEIPPDSILIGNPASIIKKRTLK
jgi:acetyltransferase-like isoleucine patch superfamily enzyme